MTGEKNQYEKAVALFNDGWDHFLDCINFGKSSVDVEAIRWMNEVDLAMRKLRKGAGDNDKA